MFEALVLVALPVVGQGVIQLLFAGRFVDVRLRWPHFAAYLCLLGVIQVLPLPAGGQVIAIGGELVVLWAILRFVLGGPAGLSWAGAILAVYIVQLSFGLINSAEFFLLPHVLETTALYLVLTLTTLAGLALCGVFDWLVLRLLSPKERTEAPDIWLLLLPGMFLFAAELYVLQTAYTVSNSAVVEPGKHGVLFFFQLLGSAVLFCALYAYRRVCSGLRTQQALSALTQAARAQKEYVAEAALRYEKTVSFRHDIKNHLSVLDGLLGAGQTENARAYLVQLDTAAAQLSFPFPSGEPAVDILLGEKLSLARDCGIQTQVSLTLPKNCGVDGLDWCVVFANALDNAIQACRSLDSGKYLNIHGERQGDFYRLSFENSAPPGPLPPMGVGLSNIQAAAEKYQGAMLVEKEETVFRLHVLLNISGHPDDSSAHLH